jgi:glyoxylase I family protein
MPESGIELEIRTLEERLLDRRVRSDPHLLDELLADDFREFGSSGRTWSKQEIIDALREERGARATIRDFAARRISPEVVLATYRVVAEPEPPEPTRSSLRSSLWVHRAGRWQIVFHQGTPSGL